MNEEIRAGFVKLAGAGFKTKSALKVFKIYKIKKKVSEADMIDALSKYPDELTAKKKNEGVRPLALKVRLQ